MSSDRKRKTDLPSQSNAKKVKTEESEEEIIVQYQRENMILRIKELNREKQQIMQQNEILEKKLEDTDNLLNNINRYWNMLNENLMMIQKKYQGELGSNIEQETNKRVYDQLLESFKRAPPEFSKRTFTQEKKDDFDFLESRCSFTINAFEVIIQALLREREDSAKFIQQLNDLATTQNDPDSAIKLLTAKTKSLENDLMAEVSKTDDLTKRINDLLSQNHELMAERNSFEKQLFVVQQQRDDFEANSIIYQRKIDKLTESLNSMNQLNTNIMNNNNQNPTPPQRPSAKVPPKKAAAAAATFQQSSELSSLSEEIKKMKEKLDKSEALCTSRLEYIDKLISEKSNLENEILLLNEQLLVIPPEKIKKSKEFTELKQRFDALVNSSNQTEKDMQNNKLIHEYEKNLLLHKEKIREKDIHIKNILDECRQEIENSKFEIAQITKEKEELAYQLLIQKAPYSNKNTIEELSKTADGYRKELTKLRTDVKNLSNEVLTLKNTLTEKKLNEETLKQIIDTKEVDLKRIQSELESIKNGDKGDINNESAVKELENLKSENKKLSLLLTEKSNQLSELNARMESDKNFTDQLYTEINDLTRALEEKETKNETIVQQLLEKEDCISQLLHEYSKSKQQEKLLKDQVALCTSKITMMEEKYHAQTELVNSDGLLAKKLNIQLENAHKEIRQKKTELEQKESAIRELRNQVDSLQAQVNIHVQNYDDFKNSTKDQILNLTREASKTFKLEEEKGKFKRKLEKLKSSTKKIDSVMEEELLTYKNIIKCPICHERNKNAVISKCFHVFCRPCLDSQLNLRQRRCPNCQKSFTSSDVHEIYLNFNN